ncbi:MAG: hypothetical protein ACREIM_07090 [Nitrospiraceae bacterium]
MLRCLSMIKVVTTVHQSGDPASTTWRIHTCVVDFGEREGPLMFSSATIYPSPEAAHAASRAQALEKIRARGHSEPEDGIVWKLQVIP